ncbi:MAG: metal/formaldehyde-sensitive transcriptional repressor [Alphaproteobacteria bacterium]|jgi:DNA-binding FrmR family transcriptional regulator|nr:metal/formaldehyde-sensitive transcriptional repressor [Alphaproteobacteria bacterium]
MAHLTDQNETLLKRVRRIRGQLEAVERALLEAKDCGTVLHLTAAAKGAIGGLIDEIIASHLQEHVARPGLGDRARAQGAEELLMAIKRYGK